jgi:hypothetical protein
MNHRCSRNTLSAKRMSLHHWECASTIVAFLVGCLVSTNANVTRESPSATVAANHKMSVRKTKCVFGKPITFAIGTNRYSALLLLDPLPSYLDLAPLYLFAGHAALCPASAILSVGVYVNLTLVAED